MRTILVALSLGLACVAAEPADEPAPSSFAWRGTLDTGGQSGLVRAALPAEALVRLQSREAADLRVFDARGEPVAFAFARPPRPQAEARRQTAGFRALPLYAAPAGVPAPKGTVQFRVDERGERRSLWVQLGADGARPAPQGAQPLQAALFDTRAQKDAVTALLLRARIPANTPVRFTFSTSPDLANWTPVAVQGRLFRFDGEGAPANDRL